MYTSKAQRRNFTINSVLAVGVVDDNGALIGVLSVTDLRSVGTSDCLILNWNYSLLSGLLYDAHMRHRLWRSHLPSSSAPCGWVPEGCCIAQLFQAKGRHCCVPWQYCERCTLSLIFWKLVIDFFQIFDLLLQYRIHRIFVVDGMKKPIGVIALGDLVKLFA